MSRLLRVTTIALAVLVTSHAFAKSPFSLVSFRKSKEVAKSSYLLTDDNGPWMVFVTSFAGGAEAEARQLVQKLRADFKLNAYLHKKHYDYTEAVEGKGFDKYGNPKRMRFATDQVFDEVAVLVGDYVSVDDAKMQKALKTIKFATAGQLALKGTKGSPTTRRFAGIRSIMQKKLGGSKGKDRKGPLGSAFATRNPMTPRDEAMTNGLDPFLIEMNKRVKYSLLENTGKYTVRVASFRGEVVIDQKKIHEIETNKRKTDDRIDSTDDKAEELTAILRERGVEAYVYHDRHESIVTIGSFAEIGSKRPDGKIELDPKVAQIINTYGPSKRRLPGNGIALAGIQPKVISRGKGEPKYLLEIAPQPVLVPRRSIASDYLSSN